MKQSLILLCLLVGLTAKAQLTLNYDDSRMPQLKKAIEQGDSRVVPLMKSLRGRGAKIMADTLPYNLVAGRTITAPSGDRRDYISLSRYWWPDPQQADGRPYIRHDGVVNPELEQYDYDRIQRIEKGAMTLATLYYLTGEERYAQRCASIVREWLLDSKTGMNPNMNYAQIIPGRTQLRGTGILDTRSVVGGLNAVCLIRGSKSWTQADEKAMHEWVQALLYWIEHSTQGQMEMAAKNNHGMWYDATRLALHLFLGDKKGVAEIYQKSVLPRLDRQQADNGSFPEELARTLGIHYSTFVMEALISIDNVVSKVGLSVWKDTTTHGRSLTRGMAFMLPYYLTPSTWPYQQISPFKAEEGSLNLYIAGLKLDKKEYVDAARKIGYKPTDDLRSMLCFDITKQ